MTADVHPTFAIRPERNPLETGGALGRSGVGVTVACSKLV